MLLAFVGLMTCEHISAAHFSSTFDLICESESHFSQSTEQQVTLFISFGTSLNKDLFSQSDVDESIWIIKYNGSVLQQGNGLGLFDVVFDKPGVYEMSFQYDHSKQHDNHTCNHYAMPELVVLNVSSVRIDILCDQITFSNPLTGGGEVTNTIMNIPVMVHTYSGEQETVEIPLECVSYGIMTSLVGRLIEPILAFTPGKHVLQYSLSGTATSGTYIGFDIIDNNGNVIPCGITTQIR